MSESEQASEAVVIAKLRTAGRRLEVADRVRSKALDDVRSALEAGVGVVSVRQMALHAGVSRVTADRLLGKQPK